MGYQFPLPFSHILWMKNSPSTYCFLRAGTSDFPSRAFICVWQPLHEVVVCENQCKRFKRYREESLQYTSFFPYKRGWSKKCMISSITFSVHSHLCSMRMALINGSCIRKATNDVLRLIAHPNILILCSSPQIAGSFHGICNLNNHFSEGNSFRLCGLKQLHLPYILCEVTGVSLENKEKDSSISCLAGTNLAYDSVWLLTP